MSHNTDQAVELLQRAGMAVDPDTATALATQAQAWIMLAQLEKLDTIADHMDWVQTSLRSIDSTLPTLAPNTDG